MPNKSNGEALTLPICPRCESGNTELVSRSPVAGAWEVYNCPVFFYSWRSSEPSYATDREQYNSHFRIAVADIDSFAQIPAIAELREKQE